MTGNVLTDARLFPDFLDFLRLQGLDRRQTQAVELAQRNLIHHAGGMQLLGRLAYGRKNC